MPIGDDVQLGRGVVIRHPELVNLYGCSIGDETFIGHGVMFTNDLHPRKRGIGKLAVRFRQDPGDLGDIYGTPEQRDNAHSVGT